MAAFGGAAAFERPEAVRSGRPARGRRRERWNTMNESVIRHALTASVSALVAALVTAMLLGGSGERRSDATPGIPAREEPRDDAALAEAIAAVQRAVERIEMGLELVKTESR